MSPARPAADWYRGFFRNSFYNPASPAALSQAPREAAFVLRQLKLKKEAALLDLCCGPGRHAAEFAARGLAVTGFDYSKEYLAEAAARARRRKVKLRLVRGDMRNLPFRGEFDAVVNLFTSFGYFLKFADDLKTLKGVARALKPGGLFLLDIIHGASVRKDYRPRDWHDLGGYYLLEDRALNADGLNNEWTRVPKRGGRPARRAFFTRLYDRRRISAALRRSGLEPLKFWGDFCGAALSDKKNRLLVLARKA